MYSDFGKAVNYLITSILPVALMLIVAVAFVAGAAVSCWTTLSEQGAIREQERQQVIEQLTPRQREVLGLSR